MSDFLYEINWVLVGKIVVYLVIAIFIIKDIALRITLKSTKAALNLYRKVFGILTEEMIDDALDNMDYNEKMSLLK